jgi:hypothetical protein
MAPIEHPAWCNRTLCTAPAERPATFEPENGRYHWSAPVPLNLRVVLTAVLAAPGDGPVTAQLCQPVAPWPCEIYLRVNGGNDGAHLNVAVRDVARVATIIGGLLGAAADSVAEATARRPAARPAAEAR